MCCWVKVGIEYGMVGSEMIDWSKMFLDLIESEKQYRKTPPEWLSDEQLKAIEEGGEDWLHFVLKEGVKP